jgi:DNA topoisomerase I
VRLRRSDPSRPGYGRRGRGFVDQNGRRISDPETVRRLRDLVIPPAWRDVWISPDPRGHIQATGIDAAGRKQYLYHPQWRIKRDAAKHDHVLEVAARLPATRRRIDADLAGRGLGRERVLATIATLLDLGAFRIGGDEYANGDDPTYGVATLRPEHVGSRPGCVVFSFPAKGGVPQSSEVTEPDVCAVLRAKVMQEVADTLGNTPAVVRKSYADPRLLDLYADGQVAEVSADMSTEKAERAVRALLAGS